MIIVLSGSQVAAAASSDANAEQAIRSVLDQQVRAWNRGDIKDFMSGYWNSPDLIYVGNTKVTRGWQILFDRFEELSKSSGGQLGTLELPETQISILSPASALVWGTYRVLQPVKTGRDSTLLCFAGSRRGGARSMTAHLLSPCSSWAAVSSNVFPLTRQSTFLKAPLPQPSETDLAARNYVISIAR